MNVVWRPQTTAAKGWLVFALINKNFSLDKFSTNYSELATIFKYKGVKWLLGKKFISCPVSPSFISAKQRLFF